MSEKPDLAALIGARICHDLISPIGAIGNGIELLTLAGSAHGPEIALISESVANASARIRFFRVAFGAASPAQRMAAKEIRTILADLAQGGRVQFDWRGPPDLARADARMAFLMILCLETALPYGGQISFDVADGRAKLVGQSPKMKIDTALWGTLSDITSARQFTAAEVQFALLAEDMRHKGRTFRVDLQDQEIRIDF
jgi:histidine phosphotransferase ChpT